VAGSCKHGNETLGAIKGREFVYHLSDYQLLKKDCFMQYKALSPYTTLGHCT
jgi:hypothetical protein